MLLLRIRNTRDKKSGNEFSYNKDGRSNLYLKKNLSLFSTKQRLHQILVQPLLLCLMIKNFECLAAQRISFSILSFL